MTEITAEELRGYNVGTFPGRTWVIEDASEVRKAIDLLKNQPVLGFDTETKPTFKKGRRNKVALLQLAFNNTALLFRVNRIGLPKELVKVLSDPGVIKAGVAIHDDIRILRDINEFTPHGFVDLQHLAKENGIISMSLKKLAAIVLGYRISKSQQVTDWNADVLTEAQKNYASTDAWVCFEIYRKLNRV